MSKNPSSIIGSLTPHHHSRHHNSHNNSNHTTMLRSPPRFFGMNDKVLVNLQLLNIANNSDDTMNATNRATVAVNKFGFPMGKGRTEEEQSGPYLYVACEVKIVHFDEIDRYYTVGRFDTGQHQRAKSKWGMELLVDPVAIKTAIAAARTMTHDSMLIEEEENDPWTVRLRMFCDLTVLPYYRRLRVAAKVLLTELLHGKAPFSCKVRCTGINLLVLCSTMFLFIQVLQLGWMPADLDDEFTQFGTVIWVILILELIFEIMIRPKDYWQLIRSDKAYRPSTARYINQLYVVGEAIALITYIPEIACINKTTDVCLSRGFFEKFTLIQASASAVLGPTQADSLFGRIVMGSMALRFFGVIRHWKQMLINQTFRPTKREGIEKWVIPYDPNNDLQKRTRRRIEQNEDDDESIENDLDDTSNSITDSEENRRLKSAANIGTALIVVNCQRALILMILSVLVLPLFYAISHQNRVSMNLTNMLESQNLISTSGVRDCEYLERAIDSWLNMAIVSQPQYEKDPTSYVLWAQVLPVRCPFQNKTGVITSCTENRTRFREAYPLTCKIWDDSSPYWRVTPDNNEEVRNYFAGELNYRGGGIFINNAPIPTDSFQFEALDVFNVTVIFNQNPTIQMANRFEFYLLVIIFVLGLSFLVIVQNDVYSLALHPVQRMLRIVVRYAENPLSSDVDESKNKNVVQNDKNTPDDIGNIETEQLLNAITKISDLLRKCWGVAGAGIISSNLGRQEDGQVAVFNPTVPGKQVYALFGFVAICGYSELLKALDRDIMILINDIAKVVHDEIYRWALGEHGQCNKNLGPAFLMVWRIGDFSEVQKKNKEAIEKMFRDKVYKTSKNHPNLRRRASRTPYSGRKTKTRTDSSTSGNQEIQLESLPGIQGFTDRALLGMLKSFAGIHRDKSLQEWKNDFRLSAGVSAFEYTVDIIYGMDAGWAVEGAVGSEYKIDATYLSPHVNMASRMMSASKQYGVTILLSKAVEKLLSKNCRKKLRHLDTVYVKGSAVKQSIYTYDARYHGVDFFLLERTPEQADVESEYYTPNIWDRDQDVRAMRQHISDDFLETYHFAVKQYLAGKWPQAYKTFEKADKIMIRTVVEEGYIEIDMEDLEDRIFNEGDQKEDIVKIRQDLGDGACRTLMNYMERRNFTAPDDWDAVRQLFSK